MRIETHKAQDVRVKRRTLRQRVYSALDAVYDWWLDVNIKVDIYKFAALIMLALYVACRLDQHNPLFTAISMSVPLFTELWWELTFLVCAIGMALLKPGRWELPGVVFLFVLPLGLFYGLLLVLFLLSGRVNIFFATLTALAAFTPIFLVTRAAVFNFYRDYANAILDRNKALEQTIADLTSEIGRMKHPAAESEPSNQ